MWDGFLIILYYNLYVLPHVTFAKLAIVELSVYGAHTRASLAYDFPNCSSRHTLPRTPNSNNLQNEIRVSVITLT
jgi:hypothetical protein